jgi:hypothetical protein
VQNWDFSNRLLKITVCEICDIGIMFLSMPGKSNKEVLISYLMKNNTIRADYLGELLHFLSMPEPGFSQCVIPQIEKAVLRMTELSIQSKYVLDELRCMEILKTTIVR